MDLAILRLQLTVKGVQTECPMDRLLHSCSGSFHTAQLQLCRKPSPEMPSYALLTLRLVRVVVRVGGQCRNQGFGSGPAILMCKPKPLMGLPFLWSYFDLWPCYPSTSEGLKTPHAFYGINSHEEICQRSRYLLDITVMGVRVP